jgi:hypothetical protein
LQFLDWCAPALIDFDVAKLPASGLIKREKLMSGFTSPLNCQLVRYRF